MAKAKVTGDPVGDHAQDLLNSAANLVAASSQLVDAMSQALERLFEKAASGEKDSKDDAELADDGK